MNINAKYALIDKINTFKGSIQPIEEFIDNAFQYCNKFVSVIIDEEKERIVIKDDGNGLSDCGWRSIRTLFEPPEYTNGFSYAGTGTKSWPAVAKKATLKSRNKQTNSVYKYEAEWDKKKQELNINEESVSPLLEDSKNVGTYWILEGIKIEGMCKGNWFNLYEKIKEKIQQKYQYKVYMDSLRDLKKEIKIKYQNGDKKKEEHIVYGKNYSPNEDEIHKLETDYFSFFYDNKMYSIDIKFFREENNSNSKSSHGIKVFFEDILMGTTKGFFTTPSARNNSKRTSKSVKIRTHDNFNPINIAVFLNHNNKDVMPIDSSKSEIRNEGWPSVLVSRLADIHSRLYKLGKTAEKLKIVNKNKKPDIYKETIKRVGFDTQNKDEDFFKNGTANSSKPFHVSRIDRRILVNPESKFSEKIVQLGSSEHIQVAKFLTPFIEYALNYSHDFARNNSGRSFNADLFKKFIEECAEDFNFGKQS